jgi:hypothetical protein
VPNPCAALAVLAVAVAYTPEAAVVTPVVPGAVAVAVKGYTQLRMPWR